MKNIAIELFSQKVIRLIYIFYSQIKDTYFLNSDGQQLHQYQQNEQPLPLTSKSLNIKIMTYDQRSQSPGLRQTQTCGGVKPVNGIQILSLLNHC